MSVRGPHENSSFDLSDLDLSPVGEAKLILEDKFEQFAHADMGPTMHRYDLGVTGLRLKKLAGDLRAKRLPLDVPMDELGGLTVSQIEEAGEKAHRRQREKRQEATAKKRGQMKEKPTEEGVLRGVKERFSRVRDILKGNK